VGRDIGAIGSGNSVVLSALVGVRAVAKAALAITKNGRKFLFVAGQRPRHGTHGFKNWIVYYIGTPTTV
jgi:hypothetical protein